MNADEMVEKLRQVQAMIREILPAALALQGEPSERPGRKYSAADRERWRDMATKPDLMMHTNRRKALLIAKREGLSAGAAETIRRELRNLGNGR
jgi:hypothetical protein